MSWAFGALAVTLGLVLLWGAIAPRSQWRALAAWSVSDPYRNEPGGAAYGVRRALNAIGVLGLMGVGIVTALSGSTGAAQQALGPTSVEKMWGAPDPTVIDRIVVPLTAPAVGLVDMPVLGYQDISADVPEYFDRLDVFSRLGNENVPGLVGGLPDVGNRALDYATLVVHVRGPLLCVPRAVTVIETPDVVQIGVYYGLPDGVAGTGDPTVDCAAGASVTGSILIPLELSADLGERTVQTLDGTAIGEVRVPSE